MYVDVCVYVCVINMKACTGVICKWMDVCVKGCVNVCPRMWMCVCEGVCVHVDINVCMCVLYKRMYE